MNSILSSGTPEPECDEPKCGDEVLSRAKGKFGFATPLLIQFVLCALCLVLPLGLVIAFFAQSNTEFLGVLILGGIVVLAEFFPWLVYGIGGLIACFLYSRALRLVKQRDEYRRCRALILPMHFLIPFGTLIAVRLSTALDNPILRAEFADASPPHDERPPLPRGVGLFSSHSEPEN